MIQELYYESFEIDCGIARPVGRRILPYMVLINSREQRESFRELLLKNGFSSVGWNDEYAGVLVNTELRRFALISKACHHACVDDRNFTYAEFTREVLEPYLSAPDKRNGDNS